MSENAAEHANHHRRSRVPLPVLRAEDEVTDIEALPAHATRLLLGLPARDAVETSPAGAEVIR